MNKLDLYLQYIDDVKNDNNITSDKLKYIITEAFSMGEDNPLFSCANKVKESVYGNRVFLRGLVEFTNFCKNNCYYCGIGCANKTIERYRLTKEQILSCIAKGYELGFRTAVLQGGEDNFFGDEVLCDIISNIRSNFPDIAITLSVGERSEESYKNLFEAGVNRFLLRHESATDEHYAKLHPSNLTLQNRKNCLYTLKKLGFQTGAGFMVGSPYQTIDHLVNDLLFLKEFQPHMVGIGPFIPHRDTIFKDEAAGTVMQTLVMLALTRLILPTALLPATTALGTIDNKGREKALNAGANVVMPNLSPSDTRKLYTLYDNKINAHDEIEKGLDDIKNRIISAGCVPDFSIGNHVDFSKKGAVCID